MIDLDEKINTKPNIDPGTVTIGNIPNFDDTPAEQKIKKLVHLGNNKKFENKEDKICNDQELERSKNDIKEKESSQLHDIDCVEFLDTLDFNDAAIDDDYIKYLDETT